MHTPSLVFVLVAISSVFARPPLHQEQRREIRVIGREQSAKVVARENSADLELLATGNKEFRDRINTTDPGLLQKLNDKGQCTRRSSPIFCMSDIDVI